MLMDKLIYISKIVPMLVFFIIFLGASFYAYRRKNKEELESLAYQPLQED